MKKLIFTLLLIFPLSTALAQDEESGWDYNWTVFTDATQFEYVSGDGFSAGVVGLGVFYNISEKIIGRTTEDIVSDCLHHSLFPRQFKHKTKRYNTKGSKRRFPIQ